MRCPTCGTELPDTARFCKECGSRLNDTGVPTPPTEHRPRSRARTVATVVAALVTVAVLAAAVFGASCQRIRTVPHPVTFMVSIDGLDSDASRIPVSITGTDVEGNKVERVMFLARSGVDTELAAGTYQVRVVGSPIASDGTIYQYDENPVSFTIEAGLAPGAEFALGSDQVLYFAPIAADEVTNRQISNAVAWAKRDDTLRNADKLEQAAKARQRAAKETKGDGGR